MNISISSEIKEKVPFTKLAVLKYSTDVKEGNADLFCDAYIACKRNTISVPKADASEAQKND